MMRFDLYGRDQLVLMLSSGIRERRPFDSPVCVCY
jgi:hypothetical protein